MENQIVEKKTNGWAIAGIICSIVVGSITGLIFSCIGLGYAKKCNSGKGLSIAGIIISVLRILLLIGLIFLFSSVMKTGEFKDSFCEELAKDKQYENACTKNDDGTYNCIFATCNFDKKEETNSEYASKNELSQAILNYLDKKATIDKDNIKITITKSIAESRYKDNKDMIVYNTDFTIECSEGKEDCIKVEDARAFPGMPVEFGSNVKDQKLKFENGQLTIGAPLAYNKKTKELVWSNAANGELENLPKVVEIK